jgi:hypothetical protein
LPPGFLCPLAVRRQLPAIKSAVNYALQAGALAPTARQRLEQVSYLTNSA